MTVTIAICCFSAFAALRLDARRRRRLATTTPRIEEDAVGIDLAYDLLVYHDMTDTTHDHPPAVGTDAGAWFGDSFRDMTVVAVGPGIHEGRVTVVLAHGHGPMDDVQRLLDRHDK